MIVRIDNIFFNTPDVQQLAKYYSRLLSLPIRRMQFEGTGINWMEINVGGMELSFRRFEGTEEVHPEIREGFIEIAPGQGATISFEVNGIEQEMERLKQMGVEFATGIIRCTEGQELIAIFKDPFGKPVQLYEAKFDSAMTAELVGSRNGAAFVNELDNFVASNVRSIQGLALSVSMQVPDLDQAEKFYVGILGLKAAERTKEKLLLEIDDAKIEIRASDKSESLHNAGVNVAFEVLSLKGAFNKLSGAQLTPALFTPAFELIEPLQWEADSKRPEVNRALMADVEGNKIEFWEKSILQ